MTTPLCEHIDYYLLPDGRLVFTETYHLKRGYCCGSGCKHCPYNYQNVPEPKRSMLLQKRTQSDEHKTQE
jgi:hypothetical protein